jgi:hypothetical protein
MHPDSRSWVIPIVLAVLLIATARIWQPLWGDALVAIHRPLAGALALGCACRVTDLRIEPGARGATLRLTTMLVEANGSGRPVAIARSRLPVAASQHALVMLLAIALAWPARSRLEASQRMLALLAAVLALELATTTMQLAAPLEAISAQVELRPTAGLLGYWSAFVETGGRLALAVLAALAAIAAGRFSPPTIRLAFGR